MYPPPRHAAAASDSAAGHIEAMVPGLAGLLQGPQSGAGGGDAARVALLERVREAALDADAALARALEERKVGPWRLRATR
jgi:hypothetical protein